MADDVPGLPGFKSYSTPEAKPSDSTPATTTSNGEIPGLPGFKSVAGQGKPEAAKPDPNAYKPPDWLPGAGFLYKTNRVFENAFTAGAADWATAKAGEIARRFGISNTTPTVAQLRAETQQDKQDVGPVASTVADVAGYGMGPGKILGPLAGKFAPAVGRYGAAALEGGGASTLNVAGEHLGSDQPLNYWDAGKRVLTGAAGGVGGQAIGDITSPAVRRVMDYTTGKPGRASELWDWRTRAAAGDPSLQRQIDWNLSVTPPGPERTALTDIQSALNQPTEPGYGAHLIQGLTVAGAAASGVPTDPGAITAALTGGLGLGSITSKIVGNPIAKGVNTIDRNINLGQAFDRGYPVLTGQPPSTTNTSNWADLIRQGWIGSQATP